MKQEQANLYEGMYILNAHIDDATRQKVFEKIKADVVKHGGEVVKIHDMKKRALMYQIGPHREGHYYLMYFKAMPSKINEMWREYRLNENIIRFMTMRAENVLEELKFQQLTEQ